MSVHALFKRTEQSVGLISGLQQYQRATPSIAVVTLAENTLTSKHLQQSQGSSEPTIVGKHRLALRLSQFAEAFCESLQIKLPFNFIFLDLALPITVSCLVET
ncbi:hypothetical protein RUE5091_00111 [Ruegeria denitrificans]|uniref:Uncharacterized protein n=1 Tax=Ruegeria denitrificans TaxID=1715692 RepID=A0A0P1IC84_9RHOB|nr:hypothetical protein RUE5091_00111 [Ruegeria denitrificans]